MSEFHRSLDRALEQGPHTDLMLYGSPDWNAYREALATEFYAIPTIVDVDEIPVAYDGFGAPLYAHQLPAEGTE